MGSYVILLKQLRSCLSLIETKVLSIIGFRNISEDHIYGSLNWNYLPSTEITNQQESQPKSGQSLLDAIIGSGFLWAVPTHRRCLEVRLTRKNAVERHRKVRKNLIVCNVCGHYHESHTICGNCYAKVQAETKAIHDAMAESWQMDPVDKDVVILYDNDDKAEKDFWKGKRIIEVKRERPLWFNQNLQTKCNTPEVSDETKVKTPMGIIHKVE